MKVEKLICSLIIVFYIVSVVIKQLWLTITLTEKVNMYIQVKAILQHHLLHSTFCHHY